jgi:4-amino-4-deoxy-L-arabinose transferase-like glycosyltransferase
MEGETRNTTPDAQLLPDTKGSTSDAVRVQVEVELAPGTQVDLEITVKAADGKRLSTKRLNFGGPAASTEQTQPVTSQIQIDTPAAASLPPSPSLEPQLNASLRNISAQAAGFFSVSRITQAVKRFSNKLSWPANGATQQWWQIPSNWLMGMALVIYLFTRLYSLSSFPIYFFTDEAVQTVLAADFVHDGFQNYDHDVFPTYFVNGNQYNLSTSVYLQVIPYLLFGESIEVTRGTSAIVTILAVIALGLALKRVFKSPFPWVAVLLLSITPAWFVHSRTAFETALGSTFFAVFLYFYLMYREVSPRYLYAAVVAGAFCFYSYSPAQMVMAVSAVLLLISDAPYHWKNRVTVLRGLELTLVLALPYARFMIQHGNANAQHLVILQSYWVSDMSLGAKLGEFFSQYVQGLNPWYWYIPNTVDLSRHLMKGYGNELRWTLPFVIIGLAIAIRNIKKSSYRTVLIALLAAPAGEALVGLGITRALFMVIPLALLTAIGLSATMEWLMNRKIPKLAIELTVFIVLAGFNLFMLHDALINGPTWFPQYDLDGMQYGAKQLFSAVKSYTTQHPDMNLIVSPAWANGTDVLARFFFPDNQPFQLGSIEGDMDTLAKIDDKTEFVMIPSEYKDVMSSGKFTDVRIDGSLPYPDGTSGFLFVHLRYVDNINEILNQEHASWTELQHDSVTLADGEQVQVAYSMLDMGTVDSLFDNDDNSVARTIASNPFKIQVTFPKPDVFTGLRIRVGGVQQRITVNVYPPGSDQPITFTQNKDQTPDPRDVIFNFNQSITADRIFIEVLSVNDTEPAHVHVWTVDFQTAKPQ